ncbi:MAG: hypothetical protein K5655_02500 [Lachnospiraceae bacterium]|nr:hypothetical protein [Lachnospiraceae bacterium]
MEDLELSIRSYNCLRRAGVYSVEQLQTMTDEEQPESGNGRFSRNIPYQTSQSYTCESFPSRRS